jgi:hypothetical protein
MESCRCLAAAKPGWLSFLGLVLLLLQIAGCAEPLPPEHTAAISKVQGLGGKVTFYRGGYSINLRNTRIEDSDLPTLHDIQNLVQLDLRDTRITDKGLDDIAKLPKLIEVSLSGTMTTRDGVKALKEQRPELDVR